MIDHLEKDRPALRGDAAESADNGVVDEVGHLAGLDRFGPVRIEDLQEMAEALALGLEAKLLVFLEASRSSTVSLLKVML